MKDFNKSLKDALLSFLMIILLITFLPISGFCQKKTQIFTYQDSTIVFSEVIIDSNTIKNNYNNTILYLNNAANRFNSMVELEKNKLKDYMITNDSTQVVGRIKFFVEQSFNKSAFEAILTVDIKENKYRYTFSDFKMIYNGVMGMLAKSDGLTYIPLENFDNLKQKTFCEKINKVVLSEINYFKKTMMKRGADW